MKNKFLFYLKKLFRPNKLLACIRHYKINRLYKTKNVSIGFDTIVINCDFLDYVWVGRNCTVTNSTIGRHTYVGGGTNISNATIGAFCSISFNVMIGLGKHPSTMVSTHPAFYSNKKPFKVFSDKNHYEEYGKIVIGNDVMIGEHAVISFGVTIGDGAIITNNAVVTKDVPPYAIVGGIPAKVIKYRFDEITQNNIIKTKWWNFDESYLEEHYSDFLDVQSFSIKYQSESKSKSTFY